MKKVVLTQLIVLLAGTLFAWFNFYSELINWLGNRDCTTGCIPNVANPFLTPCFYGAMFFTIALILSAIILKKTKKEP
jgi:hypothetical protein